MKSFLRISLTVTAFFLLSGFNYAVKKPVIQSPLTVKIPVVAHSIILQPASKAQPKGCEVTDFAAKYLKIRYRHAGRSPKTGFDCAGFVNFVYKNFDVNLPTSSSAQAGYGKKIALKDALPGDIILFKGSNAKSRSVGHVGIVVSEKNQPLRFIHSATSRLRGITYDFLSEPYYKARFVSVRRLVEEK
jgi:cell wall-associated NlpC family hydrolase